MNAKIFASDATDTKEKFVVMMLTCSAVNDLVKYVYEDGDGNDTPPEEVPLMYAAKTDQLFLPMQVLAFPFLVNDPDNGETLPERLNNVRNGGDFEAPAISMVQLQNVDFIDSSVLLTMFKAWAEELDFAPSCTLADMNAAVDRALSMARLISAGGDPNSPTIYH